MSRALRDLSKVIEERREAERALARAEHRLASVEGALIVAKERRESLPRATKEAYGAATAAYRAHEEVLALREKVAQLNIVVHNVPIPTGQKWEIDHVRVSVEVEIDPFYPAAAPAAFRPTAALTRAVRWINAFEVFVSPRIAREEFGDALENLRRFDREGRPRWHIYGHAIVCGLLAVWHTWRDVVATTWKKGA